MKIETPLQLPGRMTTLPASAVDLIVVHCSATRPTLDIGAKEIHAWHLARGWRAIGYHFVIRRDGTVEEGRKLNHQGAHASGVNDRSIGICLVGGVDAKGRSEDNFTHDQYEALDRAIRLVRLRFGRKLPVIGHRDVPGVAKDCPCFDVKEWINERGL